MAAAIDTVRTWRERIREDLFGRVLPFWTEHSVDSSCGCACDVSAGVPCGGFFNCLDENGDVYDTQKYMWMQGRQAWMFSTLAREYGDELESITRGYAGARNAAAAASAAAGGMSIVKVTPVPASAMSLLDASARAIAFMSAHGYERAASGPDAAAGLPEEKLAGPPHSTTGRVFFCLTRAGVPASMQRKPFSAAFMAQAMLAYSAARRDARVRAHALALMERMFGWIRNAKALGRDTLAGAAGVGMSPLNVPMIMLSLMDEARATATTAAEAEDLFAEETEWALAEILRHNVRIAADVRARADARNRDLPPTPATVVMENVDADGGVNLACAETRVCNPGHAIEAGWFLLHHARVRPRKHDWAMTDAELTAAAVEMIVNNFDFGWDAACGGGIIYFRDICGYTPTQLEWNMKLWWPVAEAMIAFAMAYAHTLDETHLRRFVQVSEWVFTNLCDKEHGEWFGYADRSGKVTHRFKGGPYKGCFHVPRALYMCDKLLAEAEAKLLATAK